MTPTFSQSKGYTVDFGSGNGFYNPHTGHNKHGGGILETTGFLVSGFTDIFFFDDDGEGNLRRYSLSGSTRVYADSQAGTVDYSNGKITINGINIIKHLIPMIQFTLQ